VRHYLDNAFINLKTVVFSKKLIMKNSKSIFIGLGANLPSKVYGEPIKTLGNHYVTVYLHKDVSAKVKIKVKALEE